MTNKYDNFRSSWNFSEILIGSRDQFNYAIKGYGGRQVAFSKIHLKFLCKILYVKIILIC